MEGLALRLHQSLSGHRIADINGEKLFHSVSKLIAQTYILVGYQTYNENDIALITSKLSSDLLESYRYLTLEEISLCFELGAKGEYGDFTGINLRTFTRWLKAYKTSDLRYQAVVLREQNRQQQSLPPVSDAYKEAHERAFLLQVFEQYRNGYPLERLYPSRVYLSLQSRGILHNSPEEKRHAMQLHAHWHPSSNLKISEDNRQQLIKQQAMAWLLKSFFDGVIGEGKKLVL